MFTGIVHSTGEVLETGGSDFARTLRLRCLDKSFDEDLEIGASVSVDGVCLTATQRHEHHEITFDVIASTLERSTLGQLTPGAHVNLERSMRMNDENGGHEVSGHVDTRGKLVLIEKIPGNLHLVFSVAPFWRRYLFPKGFIAINGASLTVSSVDKEKNTFDVWLIPETLRRTNLGNLQVGSEVNLEMHKATQVLVDTVSDILGDFLEKLTQQGTLDAEFVAQIQRIPEMLALPKK